MASRLSIVRAIALAALSFFTFSATAQNAAGVPGATVSNTILVFARDTTSATNSATLSLLGYGIPYSVVTVPQEGIASLPSLNASTTYGNYGGIVIVSEVGYNYNNLYNSALTTAQWQQLYTYQNQFGVRMVRLDVFPTSEFGCVSRGGTVEDQPVRFTNVTAFQTAGLKSNAPISITAIYHTPATITNSSIAWEVASFGTPGTAAVINRFGNRQQMVWFMPFALDWAPSSGYISHAWINWITRGLYNGYRRTYFSTQVDDMFLETDLYRPAGTLFRLRPEDMDVHVKWQAALNAQMPKGSEYFMEIAHNGNGDIEAAVNTAQGERSCNPASGIEYADQLDGTPEYTKPPGTGSNIWPNTPTSYSWSLQCAQIDKLQNWFAVTANRDSFAHISHTFSHSDLTNSTYSDTNKEISFNTAWLKQVGLYNAKRFSPKGIVPPAITGLYNADALRAWAANGIFNVVGDNTRPRLLNTVNRYWPLNTTVALNGYAGITIMPRWATVIYYNCDLPACTLAEWVDTSGGKGNFDDLMANARDTALVNLFGLHWDAFMFHQANLRVVDVPTTTVYGQTGQFSLIMTWVNVIAGEIMRLTTWPFTTLKHDDLVQQFLNRQTRDQCRPSVTSQLSPDGLGISSITIYTANGNTCRTPIPITLPVTPTSSTGATQEQVGTNPLTLWVTMNGSPRTYTFSKPIPLN